MIVHGNQQQDPAGAKDQLESQEKIGILIGLSIVFIILSTPYPKRLWKRSEMLLNKLLAEEEKTGPRPSEILDTVMGRHPDWDRSILEKFINEIGGTR